MRLVAVPMLAGFMLLTLLVSAYNAAVLMRDAAFSHIPASYVISLILLRDVTAAEVLLPTALYLAVLATINQWHREREAFACYAAGVAPGRISRAVAALCFAVCLAVAGLALFARPWAYGESYRLDREAANLSTSAMQPDRFYAVGASTVISARDIDVAHDAMHGVFMENEMEGGVRVVRATAGRIHPAKNDARQRLELERGTSYWISETDRADRYSEFGSLVYYAPSEASGGVRNVRRALPTVDLVGSIRPKEVAELQWRLSLPVTAFFLTLIAMELGRSLPGSSPYPRFIAGLIAYAAVFNVAALARTAVENGQIQALPGMLWVPLLSAVLWLVVRRVPRLSLGRPQ